MPTYYSDAVLAGTAYGASDVPKGMVLAVKGVYTVPTGDLVANDIVQMCPVPEGAVILDVAVASSDTTASLTIDVGDDTTVDRYLDGVTASAAFCLSLSSDGDAANDGLGYKYTEDDTIDMKMLGAAATAANVYTMVVTYVMGDST